MTDILIVYRATTTGHQSYLLRGDAVPSVRVACPKTTPEAAGVESCGAVVLADEIVHLIGTGDAKALKSLMHSGASLVDQLVASGCSRHDIPDAAAQAATVWDTASGLSQVQQRTLLIQVFSERSKIAAHLDDVPPGASRIVAGVPVFRSPDAPAVGTP